ncbi:hypothetical protein Tco_0488976 [Tanacetum coccineum]
MLNTLGYGDTVGDMLEIKVNEMEGDEILFTSEAWRRAFDINEPIYTELCQEFYSTYEFDEVVPDDELITKKVIKFRLCGLAHSLSILDFARCLGLYTSAKIQDDGFETYFLGAKTIRKPVLRVLQKMITYGLCQRTTWYNKVQKNKLWLLSMFEANHQNGYANVAWQSYQLDRYVGVHEYMARQYNVTLQGEYDEEQQDDEK